MPKISKTIKNGVTYDFHDASIWSIASDHLEEKALVWELYTLNDKLFLQNAPALDDASVDQKVWDTAANTQIHIQRITSWTASNKLKLKIKKVWTPWDLTVQVMKWILVTVTANVEAYWYWDSSNIVASWILAASNVTTSYQELEVTLWANFWWTEWDLLDVVLNQSSVDANNYYVIACDYTQWSEAFSFVAVNGSTRTRSKLMPYCVSDWFAQRLLCKVSSNYVTTLNMIVLEDNVTHPLNNNGYTYTYTAKTKGTYVIKATGTTYREDGNYNNYVYYTINVNWIEIERVGRAGATSINETKTVSLEAWDILTVYTNQMYSSYHRKYVAYVQFSTFSITITTGYLKKYWDKNLRPKEIKDISNEAAVISFGRLITGEFWRDYDIEKELPNNVLRVTDATYNSSTFDITAYRGYLSITFQGKTYKIPYTERN